VNFTNYGEALALLLLQNTSISYKNLPRKLEQISKRNVFFNTSSLVSKHLFGEVKFSLQIRVKSPQLDLEESVEGCEFLVYRCIEENLV